MTSNSTAIIDPSVTIAPTAVIGARYRPLLDGRCPTCDKPLTVGELHRVEAHADRPDGHRP